MLVSEKQSYYPTIPVKIVVQSYKDVLIVPLTILALSAKAVNKSKMVNAKRHLILILQ